MRSAASDARSGFIISCFCSLANGFRFCGEWELIIRRRPGLENRRGSDLHDSMDRMLFAYDVDVGRLWENSLFFLDGGEEGSLCRDNDGIGAVNRP